jgi:hypothetical protein
MKYCLVEKSYYDQAYGNKEILLRSNVISTLQYSFEDMIQHYIKYAIKSDNILYILSLEEIDDRHFKLIKKTEHTKEDIDKLIILM